MNRVPEFAHPNQWNQYRSAPNRVYYQGYRFRFVDYSNDCTNYTCDSAQPCVPALYDMNNAPFYHPILQPYLPTVQAHNGCTQAARMLHTRVVVNNRIGAQLLTHQFPPQQMLDTHNQWRGMLAQRAQLRTVTVGAMDQTNGTLTIQWNPFVGNILEWQVVNLPPPGPGSMRDAIIHDFNQGNHPNYQYLVTATGGLFYM